MTRRNSAGSLACFSTYDENIPHQRKFISLARIHKEAELMKSQILAVITGFFLLGHCPIAGQSAAATQPSVSSVRPPNVVMIVIDDQNDWIGCLNGHPQARTPHIDRLAKRGTLFLNAHCQAPLCNPSRTSVMTGLRPSSTGVYGLSPGLRAVEDLRAVTTLPRHFRNHGYETLMAGKIYHGDYGRKLN